MWQSGSHCSQDILTEPRLLHILLEALQSLSLDTSKKLSWRDGFYCFCPHSLSPVSFMLSHFLGLLVSPFSQFSPHPGPACKITDLRITSSQKSSYPHSFSTPLGKLPNLTTQRLGNIHPWYEYSLNIFNSTWSTWSIGSSRGNQLFHTTSLWQPRIP